MTNNKKKTAKEKRVLIASLVVAAIMIGGSTFAWFTSKDEVTNRLSASAAYDVSIAEDFTPPENWVPGQTVDKNVGVVNTGNTDAFVRTWVEGEMNLLSQVQDTAKWNTTNNDFYVGTTRIPGSAATDVKDDDLIALGLTKTFTDNGETYYLKTLSVEEQDNPTNIANSQDSAKVNGTDATDTSYSEVKTVQAGGYLAYTTGTKYSFTPNQEITVKTSDGNEYKVAKGVKVIVDTSATSESSADTTSGTFTTTVQYLGEIDSDSFKPESSGLYIFRRNVKYATDDPENPSANDYEFSGYDYITSGQEDGTVAKQGIYYALQNQATDEDDNDKQRSDYTIAKDTYTLTADANDRTNLVFAPTANLALFTAKQQTIQNSDLKWYYTEAAGTTPAMLHAFYDVDNDGKYDREDIMIDVALENISNAPATDGSESWTVIDSESATPTVSTLPTSAAAGTNENKKWTFYYNNDLEEGDTTSRFIESVTLNKDVTQYGFMAFDFDLNVFMDSIQVTVDESGNEGFDTVSGGWAADADTTIGHNGATAAKASATVGSPEINTITWTK